MADEAAPNTATAMAERGETAAPRLEPSLPAPRPERWQTLLRDAVRDPAELCRLLDLPAEWAARAVAAAAEFPLRVPRGFVSRMRPGDPFDPLLRQVLPLEEELVPREGFTADPVGDRSAELAPGVLQKYRGRALLVLTGACAVHCRYCFRRHFPYEDVPKGRTQWDAALAPIAADPSVEEVLLSGGDPLSLTDAALLPLFERLAEIPHLRRLRIHTRWPVVLPERVTDPLVAALAGSRLTPVVVIHANHARELDGSVAAAVARLRQADLLLFNQAVLLRGVNDSVAALAELSERLLELRVVPYYLHQLDRVAGAVHFEVPTARGLELIAALRRRLPGYAIPQYVREIAGEPHKTPVTR